MQWQDHSFGKSNKHGRQAKKKIILLASRQQDNRYLILLLTVKNFVLWASG
jgi:hypothetical protein